ncbi:MAG: 1-deoxy-D-xylulose-5-phosphate reductoisomerase [Clostridiales bacterium]|jgi:1-deoxy-D-xylulose-5-phosphate reductoisomerase|nr:1-deoxy-D-xylulose-5-phosphate reductoisomerase [Clostridiales bacterium]MDK2932323.1 1-deoxy-D-xylulose-5-phosphate reductoisomerase [Clostridiales bacterium]
MKNISILGSTGSIGTQTLEVIDNLKGVKVWGLSTNTNIHLLEEQIRKYHPVIAAVMDPNSAKELKKRVKDTNTHIVAGLDGLVDVTTIPQVEMVITSVVGIVGLIPTLEAIKSGKHIALANKETLVTAGKMVMREACNRKVSIIPVDSEHSAIFQCLQQNAEKKFIKRLLVTASGGPFLGKKLEELKDVTPEQALKHPKWNMGNKISIDSATLMNKGLEVIEAKWLFDVDIDSIQVLIHPQSIVHSMVEYIDHSIIAQLGVPDMKMPIQYAITYPERYYSNTTSLDFIQNNKLTFSQPDFETFKCLVLAYRAAKADGTMPVILNAANEVAVQLFLERKIGFTEIPELIEQVMEKHDNIINPTLKDILSYDSWAREMIYEELRICK